jgi:hypothetical protein
MGLRVARFAKGAVQGVPATANVQILPALLLEAAILVILAARLQISAVQGTWDANAGRGLAFDASARVGTLDGPFDRAHSGA